MKLLVDGVFFQLARTGIARVWSSILPRLVNFAGLEIVMLDRGNCPPIAGIQRVEFPSYMMHSNTSADSLLLEQYCRELGADVFMSTYYTTPVAIPSVLLIYDMIPEVLGFDLNLRAWQEKQLAISFASYYACISENTRTDLRRFYPSIGSDRIIVSQCGLDRDTFYPRTLAQVEDFKRRYGVSNFYYLLVGLGQPYKNAALVFDAMQTIRNSKVELICIGRASESERETLARLPGNISTHQLELSDEELACAYSGARALVFPSLYEGFGLPVIEAMACGCPVITTKLGPLGEVAGDAASFISGRDRSELVEAMALVGRPEQRSRMIEKGLQRATLYNWDAMASSVFGLMERAVKEAKTPAQQAFFAEWKRVRTIQAEVDTV
jgi:glycosyltransferase involved in cell wall biosynthesis